MNPGDVVPRSAYKKNAWRTNVLPSNRLQLVAVEDRVWVESGIRISQQAHEESCDVAWVAASERLKRMAAHIRRTADQGHQGQSPARRWSIDLAQELHGPGLIVQITSGEYAQDRRHGAGVGHPGQGTLGLGAMTLLQALPLRQQWPPLAIGCLLCFGLGFLGHDLRVGEPTAVVLPASQPLPRGLMRRIEPGHSRQMSQRLGTQALLLTPDRELPVSVGRMRRPGSPSVVLSEIGTEPGIHAESS